MAFIWSCWAVLMILCVRFSFLANTDSLPTKRATQSSTYLNYTADLAIDGNLSTWSLAAVDYEPKRANSFGWWQVDLGDIFNVYSITMTTGKNETIDQYARNFSIFVRNDNNTDSSNNVCSTFNNGSYVRPEVPLTLECNPNPLSGRYVTIKRLGGLRYDAIGFCEVEITYAYGSLTSSTAGTQSSFQFSTPGTITSTKPSSRISTETVRPSDAAMSSTATTSNCVSSDGNNSRSEVNGAAVALGILFGVSLLFNIVFVVWLIKRRKLETTANTTTSTVEQPHQYEKLRVAQMVSPGKEVPPNGTTLATSKETESQYEEVVTNLA